MTKRRASPEYALHCQVADYLSRALSLEDGVWWTTFPAGGGGKVRGARLKRMGLKAGVPDILILIGGDAFWIELKAKGGRVSSEQSQFMMAICKTSGLGRTAVCRSVTEVEHALQSWHIPTRARIAA